MTKTCAFLMILLTLSFALTTISSAQSSDPSADNIEMIVKDKKMSLDDKVDAISEMSELNSTNVIDVAKLFVKLDKLEGHGRIANVLIEKIEAVEDEAALDIFRERVGQDKLHNRLRIAFFNAIANNDLRDDIESYIVGLTTSPNSSLRVLSVTNCGENVYPEGFENVLAALDDGSWRVQVSAIEALVNYSFNEEHEHNATAAIIEFMGRIEGRLIEDCAQALRDMSGEDYGTDAKAWATWFGQSTSDSNTPSDDSVKNRYRVNKIYTFDVATFSKQLIFVVDSSDSMKERITDEAVDKHRRTVTGAHHKKDEEQDGIDWSKIETKLDLAKAEFERAIKALPEDSMFTVISYSTKVNAWKPQLVQATEGNKKSAVKYVNALKTGEFTNTYGALDYAISLAEEGFANKPLAKKKKKSAVTGKHRESDKTETSVTDTIYFLSDGFATAGKYQGPKGVVGAATQEQIDFYTHEMDAMVGEIEHRNQVAKIIIHTIGIGVQHDRWTLPKISNATGGTYVAIGVDK